MYKLQKAEFEMEALFLPVIQFVECLQHHLQKTGEILFAEKRSGAGSARAFIWRKLNKLGRLPTEARHEAITQIADKLTRQLGRAVSRIQKAIDLFKHSGALVPI